MKRTVVSLQRSNRAAICRTAFPLSSFCTNRMRATTFSARKTLKCFWECSCPPTASLYSSLRVTRASKICRVSPFTKLCSRRNPSHKRCWTAGQTHPPQKLSISTSPVQIASFPNTFRSQIALKRRSADPQRLSLSRDRFRMENLVFGSNKTTNLISPRSSRDVAYKPTTVFCHRAPNPKFLLLFGKPCWMNIRVI